MSVPSSSLDSSYTPFSSLRALQYHQLSRLFRSDSSSPSSSEPSESSNLWFGQWKLLIYDEDGQAILSPLFNVSDLRRLGVTLHLNLNSQRENIPDVPAIYFIKPTLSNISKLSSDIIRGLYTQNSIHFTTCVPRSLLENLAQSTAESGSANRISLIRDEYSQFICLEDQLFISNHTNSLIQLNNPSLPESELFSLIDSIVDSLFSVFATMGVVPFIRAKAGNAAELVANRLDQRLREHLSNRQNLFSSSSLHRPLLLLLDRQFDYSTPLHHTWTYQALLCDILGLRSNRLSVPVESQGAPGEASNRVIKTYDLSTSEDKFWRENAGNPFPKVAEAVQAKLENYQTEIAAIQKKPGAGGAAAARPYQDSTDSAAELHQAISALPKLQKKKRMLDQHVNIATALLKEIKARDIDCFFEIEEGFLAKSALSIQELEKLLGNDKETPKGSISDRIRALCIWFLQQEEIPDDNVLDALRKSIISHGEQKNGENSTPNSSSETLSLLSAIDFLNHWRFLHRLSSGQSRNNRSQPINTPDSTAGAGWSMIGKFAEKMVTQTAGVLAGVRNLIPASEELPISRSLDALLNRPDSEEARQFIQLDPKAGKKMSNQVRSNQPIKEAIVFVLGGGSFCEYENVQDFQRKHSATGLQSCIYGATEMLAPEQFLKQLATLGAKQKQPAGSLPVD
jgi:hypothetical protein